MISIDQFSLLAKEAEKRYGPDVMVSAVDADDHMQLTKKGEHLGYIDIKTGDLVWDDMKEEDKPSCFGHYGYRVCLDHTRLPRDCKWEQRCRNSQRDS